MACGSFGPQPLWFVIRGPYFRGYIITVEFAVKKKYKALKVNRKIYNYLFKEKIR